MPETIRIHCSRYNRACPTKNELKAELHFVLSLRQGLHGSCTENVHALRFAGNSSKTCIFIGKSGAPGGTRTLDLLVPRKTVEKYN